MYHEIRAYLRDRYLWYCYHAVKKQYDHLHLNTPIQDFSRHSHVAVVARFNEDCSWTAELDYPCVVYNKHKVPIPAPASNVIVKNDVFNLGREGETYLSFILAHYDCLPERVTFLQADPKDHSPDFMRLLCELPDAFAQVQPLSYRYSTEVPEARILEANKAQWIDGARAACYRIDCNGDFVDALDGWVDQGIEYLNDKYIRQRKLRNRSEVMLDFFKRINLPFTAETTLPFAFGALFSVTKERILAHPREFYLNMREVILENSSQGFPDVYIAERCWLYIFGLR